MPRQYGLANGLGLRSKSIAFDQRVGARQN
jgi:hypothetical protein